MQLWLFLAAGAFAIGGAAAWFLSARPILYTRLFVSRDERPLVRREIMDGLAFQWRMRWSSLLMFLVAGACVAGAVYIKRH